MIKKESSSLLKNFNKTQNFPTNNIDSWLNIDDYHPSENIMMLTDENEIEWVNLSFDSSSNTKLDDDDVSYSSPSLHGITSYRGYFVDSAVIKTFEPNSHASNHCYKVYLGEYPHSPAFTQCILEEETVFSDEEKEFTCIELLRGGEWEYDYSSNVNQSSISMPSPNIINNMNLTWDNNSGWLDKHKKLAVFSFSGEIDSGLFIRKDILDQFLSVSGKTLVIAKFIRKQFSQGFGDSDKMVEVTSRYSYGQQEGFESQTTDEEKFGFDIE
mgnify:CR=1 FL=1